VQPGPELLELELAVLRRSGDLELRGPVKAGAGRRSHTLPAPISSFVGRDRGLRELAGLLSEHRLVMLTGTGGSGKTRPAPGRPVYAGALTYPWAMAADALASTTSSWPAPRTNW
jgi:hypothetical protein